MAVSAATHCIFCINDVLHPKDDDRKLVIIFVDTDALARQIEDKCLLSYSQPMSLAFANFIESRNRLASKGYISLERKSPKAEAYHQYLYGKKLFNPTALATLEGFRDSLARTGMKALIVIKNDWCQHFTVEELRNRVYNDSSFGKHICGKTDGLAKDWLEKHALEKAAHVTIDRLGFSMGEAALLVLALSMEEKG